MRAAVVGLFCRRKRFPIQRIAAMVPPLEIQLPPPEHQKPHHETEILAREIPATETIAHQNQKYASLGSLILVEVTIYLWYNLRECFIAGVFKLKPVARQMKTPSSIRLTVIAILSRHQAQNSFEISHRRSNLTHAG